MTSNIIGKTCPYCQTPIKPGVPAIACPSCGMPHHQDCWQENGGCTTFGCPGRQAAQPASQAQPRPTYQNPSPPRSVAYQRPMPPPLPPGMVYQQQQRSQLGLVSMIMGIVSVVMCICWFLAPIFGILAIVFGVMAKKDPTADQGMATAGLITGSIGVAFSLIILIAGVSNGFNNFNF